MKKIIPLIGLLCLLAFTSKGQFLDKIKKAQKKVEKAVDKSGSNTNKKTDKDSSGTAPAGTDATKPENTAATTPAASGPNSEITSYSKFDFVPGAKIIVQEDFAQDAIGDFPAKWNTRTGAEVVTVSNRPGKWLAIKQDGIFFPEYITSDFPENFTLQLDLMAGSEVSSVSTFSLGLIQAKDANERFEMTGAGYKPPKPGFKLGLAPVSSGHGRLYYSSNVIGQESIQAVPEFNVPKKNAVTISIWRQKQRVRVYLDSTKTLDLPRALDDGAALNSLVFLSYAADYNRKGGAFYISNIRLAVGAPDTRNKLITEGKFVTHGILFDVNSDKLQPASHGSLQDIANVLKENAAVRVKIIGHTDADGEDQPNIDLSKRRAEAVKVALAQSFGVDAARMETDGKGETQPLDDNNTPAGKANNRRVEFVKL